MRVNEEEARSARTEEATRKKGLGLGNSRNIISAEGNCKIWACWAAARPKGGF